MPTQATSHIMNMTECFEPITQLLFNKQVLSGTYIQLNQQFQTDMLLLGLWNREFSNKLMELNGDIANIEGIPEHIKNIYKTIWSIKPTDLIQMDADRGHYICQTQSSNRYVTSPNKDKLFTIIKKAYEAGLKTGCYYLRSKAAANAIKFTVKSKAVCTDEICTMCQ
jgi:ribonucleoside-diphosphate reductase alpha chain